MTAITAGAAAISIEDAELIAGAFYCRDPVPIVSMAARPEPEDNWPDWPWPYRATRLRRMRDGRMQIVHTDVHPDERVQRVIEQIREAGVIQDLDRVRPIYNHRTLVVMNELVLDLTYDRVLRHRELVEGGTRIDRVLKRTDGILPMTPEILSMLFPEEMGSVSTARRAIRAWIKWGHGSNRTPIWGLTPFNFRLPYQRGSPSVVLISPHHPDPKAAWEAMFGPVAGFSEATVAPPPTHPAPPPADAPPTPETARQGGLRPASHTQWVPPTFGQPGNGAANASSMVHGPPDG